MRVTNLKRRGFNKDALVTDDEELRRKLRLFTVHSRTELCTLLSVKMEIVVKTLSQKTQKRVLGRSAGVPCEVASGLRSHNDKNNLEKEFYRRKSDMGMLESERKFL